MRKTFLRLGSVLALVSVALGALGSHTLENYLEPEQLSTFETGVRYQFYHTFAILMIGVLLHFGKKSRLNIAGWLFFGGILLFSGSLYLLSIQDTLNLKLRWLGPVTPIGGLSFMAGWVFFLLSTFQHSERKSKSE